MLKTGYFTHSNISPSETFIYDLVKALNNETDIDLTYVSGQKIPPNTDFKLKSISTHYAEKNIKWAFRLYKLGQIKGGKGQDWKMRFQQHTALKQLQTNKLSDFDVAYVDYATSAVLLMNYFDINKIPFIVHVHGYDITASLKNNTYKIELCKLFDKATYFIAASQYMKRRLILLGCNEDKIKVISYGVSSNNITPMSWLKRRETTPSIIFLGRLTEKKHPIALLHAFKLVKQEIPNVKLSIIGDGPLRKEIDKTIKQLQLSDSVKLYGTLSRKESFPIMNQHWVYAQHSVTAISGDTEGFAISLSEAALHELPVVSTVHNGIVENVIHNKTGYLVSEYDFETMAEKIIYLIKNPNIAEQMGKAGREHIMELCAPEKRVNEIKSLLFKAAKR